MNATFLDVDGKPKHFEMGCYGIGVTRILGAAIEQKHDARGIIWPDSIAPFTVVICPVGYDRSEAVKAAADQLHADLLAKGVDVILDDRGERPGAMFADWELIGVPHRVVLGDKGLKEGLAEYQGRADAEAAKVPSERCAGAFAGTIAHGVSEACLRRATRRSQDALWFDDVCLGSLFPLGGVVHEGLCGAAVRCRATGLLAASSSTAWAGAQIEEPRRLGALGPVAPPWAVVSHPSWCSPTRRNASNVLAGRRPRKRACASASPRSWCVTSSSTPSATKPSGPGLEPSLVLGLIQVESGFRRARHFARRGTRLYADHAVLVAHHRQWRSVHLVPHADQHPLWLRDPAPLPRPRKGQPLHGPGALQRQPRARRVSEHGHRPPHGSGATRTPPPRAWPKARPTVQKVSYTQP